MVEEQPGRLRLSQRHRRTQRDKMRPIRESFREKTAHERAECSTRAK